MNHTDFLSLTEEEQLQMAMSKGVRVAARIQGMYKYVLYQLDSFYLEGIVDRKSNKTERIYSFASTEGLDKYLEVLPLPPDFYNP